MQEERFKTGTVRKSSDNEEDEDDSSRNGSEVSLDGRETHAYAAARKLRALAAAQSQKLSGKISSNGSNASPNSSNGVSPDPTKNDTDNVSWKITVSVHEGSPREDVQNENVSRKKFNFI